MGSTTEAVSRKLAAQREDDDPISEARRQVSPDRAWVIDVLDRLRAIVFEQTPSERLTSDLEVVHGVVAGLIGSEKATKLIECLPEIRHCVSMDVEAAFQGDPAAKTYAEVVASYPSVFAISTYRIAHEFYGLGAPVVGRIMTEHAKSKTGIDIHPGAEIGCHFFIDHGTGVVVGETAIIGNRVKMYHGVTLGAYSNKHGRDDIGKKRHPTIEDDVTIYPNASILGGKTVIGSGSVIGGNVWITQSVPEQTRVQIEPPRLQVRQRDDQEAGSVESYDI